ncbi:MAG: MlaD family protein [Bacteroidales bacterium]|nr:MlaD family protein [Bacteroidales bacterium]MCF8326778.1 MlaD family protein [Bacteroidales bacterium]
MRKEVRIGILVIAAVIIFIWGYNYLANNDLFGKSTKYYAVYPEIKNLSKSNPVRINGVKIGVVQDVKFPLAPGDHRVLVTIGMEKEMPLPNGTIAKIESDLLGSNMINLKLGNQPGNLEVGDTLNTEVATSIQEEVSLQMMPVKRKAENLMLQLDSVLEVVKYVFNEENRKNITESFASIKNTIDNLENTTSNLDNMVQKEQTRLNNIIGNVESITANLKNNKENINRTFDNLAVVSDTLAKAQIGKTFKELSKTADDLNRITQKIEDGEGTLGKLLENDTLYYQLESSAGNLDKLVHDIQLNPQRYIHFSIFGKDPNKTQHKDTE